MNLWAHRRHPECGEVAFFAVTGSVADALIVGLLLESVHTLRHNILLRGLEPGPGLLLLPVGAVPELLLFRLQLLLVLLKLLVVLFLFVKDESDDGLLVKDPPMGSDDRVGGRLESEGAAVEILHRIFPKSDLFASIFGGFLVLGTLARTRNRYAKYWPNMKNLLMSTNL